MGTHPIFESDFDCLTDEVIEMRLTLFVSILVCLVVLPCVVLQYVAPPLHPLPRNFAFRALIGFCVSFATAQKSANKISPDGAMAAMIVGTILTAASPVFIVAIFSFFFTSTRLTKFRSDQKKEFDPDHRSNKTQRNAINVICNGGVSCAYSLLFVAVQKSPIFTLQTPKGIDASWLFLAITGSIAGAAADTWASEVGTVVGFSSKKTSKEKEMKKERLRYCRLVVWPWKKVPRG